MCGHKFHQHCVDPWLINRRHCPLCNLDILTAYQIPIPGIDNRQSFRVQEAPTSVYYSSLATTSARPITEETNVHREEQQQITIQMQSPHISSISRSIKNNTNNEENSLPFRPDDRL